MTATMIRPVTSSRTPALTLNVFSMVSSSTRNSAAPPAPGTLALPRLDMQPGAIGNVDRLDDEARRQRRDDRRYAQSPDEQVVGRADGKAAGERRGQAEGDQAVVAVHRLHRHRAGKADVGRQRQ